MRAYGFRTRMQGRLMPGPSMTASLDSQAIPLSWDATVSATGYTLVARRPTSSAYTIASVVGNVLDALLSVPSKGTWLIAVQACSGTTTLSTSSEFTYDTGRLQ